MKAKIKKIVNRKYFNKNRKDTQLNDEKISKLLQYCCELAKIKYDSELRREDSIIQQSGHMQTVFSFSTAALFMIAPIVVQYRGSLSLTFLLIVFASITVALLFSLFSATMAQNRQKQVLLPGVAEQIKYIEDNENLFTTEAKRQKYLVKSYAEIQKSLTEKNRKRVCWVQISMWSFYVALSLCCFWFIVAICKII